MDSQRVFLTGLGLITSIGNDKREIIGSLRSLRHGFSVYPAFENDAMADVKLVAAVKDFDVESRDFEDWSYPSKYKIRRETLRSMGPHGLYTHCAMMQAIADAELEEGEVSNANTGVYTASAGSPMLLYHNLTRMRQLGPMRCPPLGIVASISGTLSFNLVAAFKIQGNSCGFSSACASSAHALGYAFDDIAFGRQKRMFVAAGEDSNYESVLPFSGMRALSLESDPERASCPFDRSRNGFVSAGGGVVLVLESEGEMLRRGSKPYAEILGWGQASDGHNVAVSHPEGVGLARAMQQLIERCKIDRGEIDYINAHATSTLIGDASEGKAIRTALGEFAGNPRISSIKAIAGHGLSFASVLETAVVGLSMREGITPGSAHIRELDREFEDLNIIRKTESVAPRLVLSNSSGFGGANVCIAMKKPG